MTVPILLAGHRDASFSVFCWELSGRENKEFVRKRTQVSQSCTSSIQTQQYKRTIIARSWKRLDQAVNFSGCVVEMRGEPEAITARCSDDVLCV